jgi:4,5-dihydroxyphthalate decarboxylase
MAIPLTLAINDYDHSRDVTSGRIRIEGIDLTALRFDVEEIFFRFVQHKEWDVSELSLAKFCSLKAAGDDSFVAIPVFPSRMFRHSAIFVRSNGPVDDPGALRGGRIGVPEWTQTATVYARGLLEHECGVPHADVRWVQAGTNEPGRIEGISFTPPPGLKLEARPDQTLNDMLLDGELDAVIAAHPPAAFKDGSGRLRHLFSNPRAVEEKSYRETGVFPIMHVLAIRAAVYREHPWIAMNLFRAFEAAKAESLARLRDVNASRFPLPWVQDTSKGIAEMFGEDFWPYGLEPNRTTLDTFLGWAHEQAVCVQRLQPEDLFVPEVLIDFRV